MEVIREKHRHSLEMIVDIMNAILQQEKARISILCRVCNMSHYMLQDRLNSLLKRGYITLEETGTTKLDGTKRKVTRTYSMTTAGKEFLVAMNKYWDDIQSLNL